MGEREPETTSRGSTVARLPLPRTLVAPVRRRGRRGGPPGSRPPGQAPGAQSGGLDSAIVDCALYTDGVRSDVAFPLDHPLDAAHEATGCSFVWIGLHEPSEQELDTVAREFGLHPLAVEDAVHAHQRPKLEVYGDTLFAVFKTVRYIDPSEVIEVGEVMLFLGPDFVVSVRHGQGSALAGVRRDLETRPELLRAGPSAVLYAVADRIVDDYAVAAAGVEDDVEEIEEEVFSDEADNRAERIYKLKREVLAFRRAVVPLAAPLDRLARGQVATLDPRTAEYFRDVQDHLLQRAEQIEGFSELLNGALDANIAGVTMRQNEDMRKITAWVAIVSWVTMIGGVYGMNFTFMPELEWRFGYPFALAVMLGGALFLYRAFKRNDWL